MNELKGEVALITGAAGGIGRAICKKFAGEGAAILALDLDGEGLNGLAEELQVSGCKVRTILADITDGQDVAAKVRQAGDLLGTPTILVNNAGGARDLNLKETTPQNWRSDLALNLDGAFNCVEAVRQGMMDGGYGVIVNIGSVNGLLSLGHPAYSVAKAGLIQYTKALAVEFGAYGLRANIVCPGTVKTQLWDERIAKNPKVMEDLLKWYPLNAVPDTEDIAEAALFLASPRARAITGIVLPVDAGLTAGNLPLTRELTQEAR